MHAWCWMALSKKLEWRTARKIQARRQEQLQRRCGNGRDMLCVGKLNSKKGTTLTLPNSINWLELPLVNKFSFADAEQGCLVKDTTTLLFDQTNLLDMFCLIQLPPLLLLSLDVVDLGSWSKLPCCYLIHSHDVYVCIENLCYPGRNKSSYSTVI